MSSNIQSRIENLHKFLSAIVGGVLQDFNNLNEFLNTKINEIITLRNINENHRGPATYDNLGVTIDLPDNENIFAVVPGPYVFRVIDKEYIFEPSELERFIIFNDSFDKYIKKQMNDIAKEHGFQNTKEFRRYEKVFFEHLYKKDDFALVGNLPEETANFLEEIADKFNPTRYSINDNIESDFDYESDYN